MTTWLDAVDLSYDHPDYAALAKSGVKVVLRYLSHTAGKGLTAAERDTIWAAGMTILPLYETTADMALGGKAAGVTAATEATSIGRSLGLPADVEIWYALDQDYGTAQMAGPVSQFAIGVRAVAGPDGFYAGIDQLNYLVKAKLADGSGFQTYAWSGGKWTGSARIQQYQNNVKLAGGTVDRCRVDSSLLTWGPDMTAAADDVWNDDIIPNTAADASTNPTTKAAFALGDVRSRLITLAPQVATLQAEAVALKAELDAVKAQNVTLAIAVARIPTTALPSSPADVAAIVAGVKAVLLAEATAAANAVK